jgi:hypothetical protein
MSRWRRVAVTCHDWLRLNGALNASLILPNHLTKKWRASTACLPGFPEQCVGDRVRVSIRRSMINPMQLAPGIVVGGKVVVEGDPLPEGTVVTILARDANETFEVPPELEAELLESMAQADRGETISADEIIERLRRIT